jgi:hypothetical protein
MSNNFISKFRAVYVIPWKKYGRTRKVTDEKYGPTSFATDTHSEYVVVLLFHGNNGYANASKLYVIRALPVLYFIMLPTTEIPGYCTSQVRLNQ